jgi:phospholipase C
MPATGHNKFGFTFAQYGPRVPAVVISPWIPKNVVDHRLYDHASIPATVGKLFGLNSMTARDASANTVLALLSLDSARGDAPTTLPSPAGGSAAAGAFAMAIAPAAAYSQPVASRPNDSVNDGNLPVVLHAAMRQDIELSPPDQREAIIRKVATIKTRSEAASYLASVSAKRNMAEGLAK